MRNLNKLRMFDKIGNVRMDQKVKKVTIFGKVKNFLTS
jgi:hypothetical protein